MNGKIVADVSASELLNESPQTEPHASSNGKRTLYAEDFPGVEIKPLFPGATVGKHPDTKRFISLKKKPSDSVPEPRKPVAFAANSIATEPTATTAPPEPETAERPDPNFDDLGGGEQTAERPETHHEPSRDELKSHEKLAGMSWDWFIGIMSAFFGEEWLPGSPEERQSVIDPWVAWLVSIKMWVMSPLQFACAATGQYCWSRFGTLVRWFKNRGKMKRAKATDETVPPDNNSAVGREEQ